MSETITQTEQQTTETTQTPEQSNALANAMWGESYQQPQQATQAVLPNQNTNQAVEQQANSDTQSEVVEVDAWIKSQFGVDSVDGFRSEWNELRKLKEQPAAQPEEFKFENDESKKFFQLIKEGKQDEIRRVLNQQAELDKLEKYEISDVSQASEIIKANLQFKYGDLSPQQIDRMYARQYTMPSKPVQHADQGDDEYAQDVAEWQRQVQEKEQDIMIDAKIAKPELANFKSKIVLPDIPGLNNAQQQQQGPSQEELAAQEAFRNAFIQKLGADYSKFKGYNVTAKDGDVELPVNYIINDEENLAFNATVQKAVGDINSFLDNDLGWWDKDTKSFNVNKIQEDLYLLMNKGKVFQAIANKAATQRHDHQLKVQNNIKLNGVNNTNTPIQQPKPMNEQMAETIWNM